MACIREIDMNYRKELEALGYTIGDFELHGTFPEGEPRPCLPDTAMNRDGCLIGSINTSLHSTHPAKMIADNGIVDLVPFGKVLDPDNDDWRRKTCSVGKATKGKHKGKWIGYSHWTACPFGIGDMLYDRHAWYKANPGHGASDTPTNKLGVIVIETDDQARQAAAAFAAEVS